MRYFALIIVTLSLMACNLATAGTDAPIQATPTASGNETPHEQLGNIAYWHLLPYNEVVPEDGDYVLFEQFVLRRTESDVPRTGTNIIDLERALQAMFEQAELWNTNNLRIESLSIDDGLATVRLNGEITAVADIIMLSIPVQIQLTVFEEPGINQLLMTINGQNIANFGISHDSQAQPDDFVFTRDGLESYFTP